MNILLPQWFKTAKKINCSVFVYNKKESGGTQPRHASLETLRFTSETRTGDTDSSTRNINENGTAVKPMPGMSEQNLQESGGDLSVQPAGSQGGWSGQ